MITELKTKDPGWETNVPTFKCQGRIVYYLLDSFYFQYEEGGCREIDERI